MRLLLLITALFFSVSCTRGKAPARISINLSQMVHSKGNSSFSVEPFAIILNVTGPEVTPIFVEAPCNPNCYEINAEVPAGKDLLIQLLVVGSESGNTESKIFYGAIPGNLPSGDVFIELPIAEVASFQNEAKLMGRYIPSPGHALAGKKLTGKMSISVKPNPNHPAMKIQEGEIFGGWFHTFLLDTVKFKFFFKGWDKAGHFFDNVEVMNDLHDGLGLNSAATSLTAGTGKLKINPNIDIFREGHGGSYSEKLGPRIIGFFGDNSDGRSLCSQVINPANAFLFDGGTDPDGIDRNRLCATQGATCGTWAQWPSHFTMTGSLEHCPAVTATTEWTVDVRSLDDAVDLSGFYGPFHRDPFNSINEPVQALTTPPGFAWFLNPDSFAGDIEVFIRTNQGPFNRDAIQVGDGFDCSKLPEHGFVSKGVVDRATASYFLDAAEIAAFGSGNAQFGLCMVNPAGGYFQSAAIEDDNNAGGPLPPASIHAYEIFDPTDIENYMNDITCVPIMVELFDSQNNPTHVQGSPININAVVTNQSGGTTGSIYDDPHCTSAASNFDVYDRKTIYVEVASAGTFTYDFTDTNASPINPFVSSVHNVAFNTTSNLVMMPSFYRDGTFDVAISEQCVPFLLAGIDTNGQPSPMAVGNVSYAFGSGSDFVAADCTTSLGGTIATPSGESLFEVYLNHIMTVASADSFNLNCNHAGYGCNPSGSSVIFNFVLPGSFDHFHPQVVDTPAGPNPEDHTNGTCLEVDIGSFDNHHPNSYPTNFPDSSSITLDVDGSHSGQFYPTSGCSSAVTSIPANNTLSNMSVWFLLGSTGENGDLIINYQGVERRIFINSVP